MTASESSCNCALPATAADTGPACTCGCCGPPSTDDQEITALHRRRVAIDRRLAELEQR
jgi:hypothetical protein